MQVLILFDLDGTVLRSHNGFIPFNQAIEKTFGVPGDIRSVIPDGNTDPVILEEIFATANVDLEITADQWAAFAVNLHKSYSENIQEGRTRFHSLPGVRELLRELEAKEGVYQGIVTGNLEITGKLKLEAVGLSEYLSIGAFGSDSPNRPDLPVIARERWEQALGEPIPAERCLIVGDTPKDLEAARRNQMKCLLVGTGRYPFEELYLLGPDGCVSDFTDTEAAVETLLSCVIS